MSTDHEREALARLIAPDLGQSVVGVPEVFTAFNDQRAYSAADRIIAAGWMPRPEPGSPEEQAMVERAARAIATDMFGDSEKWRLSGPSIYARDALRAALGTGDA